MLRYLLLLVAVFAAPGCAQTAAAPQSASSQFSSGEQLYRAGRFAEAAQLFQTLVKADPRNTQAQSGLVHSLLRLQKLDEALAAANAALSVQPDSSPLITALGDVQFRSGKIADAERSYLKAMKLNGNEVGAHLGLAQVYRSYSLYRSAYDQLKRAHELVPASAEVTRDWMNMLAPRDRVAAIEAYLAGPHSDDPRETASLQSYLEALKAALAQPQHSCQLVSRVSKTNTKLEPLRKDPQHIGGYALEVRLNGRKSKLVVDTGTSGMIVSRDVAEAAGMKRISDLRMGGLGDAGQQHGYIEVADRIRIGDLEFQDCLVRVTETATFNGKNALQGQDGLIGTDVFGAYQIDVDFPGEKLRLSPLPKRPEEPAAPTSLSSGGEDEEASTQTGEAGKPSGAREINLPKDAYVAPEMQDWTKVFRFHQVLLIPTAVDQLPPSLFMIDTGSFTNILSTRRAREVSQVSVDQHTQIKGLSGNVGRVYRTDQAMLAFGRYQQEGQNIVTLDLSNISAFTGTEVSGILGYDMLRLLEVKIDYRDGLVDFHYDPHRLPRGVSIKKQK